jgi:hypothetical protein
VHSKRIRLTFALAASSVAALGFGAAAESAATQSSGSVGITAFPTTIAVGQVVLISGFVVNEAGQRIGGAEVTVKRYAVPRCASGATTVAVLTTGAGGDFSLSDLLTVNPPVAYGFFYPSQDPARAPDFQGSDSCVTIGPGSQVSAQAQGEVLVDGVPFTGGVIVYGSTVDLKPMSRVKLSADVGRVEVYALGAQEGSFVLVRTSEKQKGKRVRTVELRLVGGDFSNCKKGKKTNGLRTESAKKPPPKRSLWANGKGHYRTKGKYSSATVSGTFWLTEDTCDGTLTVVKRGVVQVRDLVRHKTVIVTAGHRYLVRAPR